MPVLVGFCFEIREGVQLLAGFQALTAFFWISSLPYTVSPWPSDTALRYMSIAFLLTTSALGMIAVRTRSEACALVLILSFSLLLVFLTADFTLDHPDGCDIESGNKSELGILLANLLWTTDACLLMSILGWVTIGVGYLVSFYLWYMYLCFWWLLRAATADARLVKNAIAALPVLRHKGKDTEIPVLDGREPSETSTCAICLCDFEVGEELRLLPCVHLFHKPCIDAWIQRQGLSASCPLCKRLLLPRHAPDVDDEGGSTSGTGGAVGGGDAADTTSTPNAEAVGQRAATSEVDVEAGAASSEAAPSTSGTRDVLPASTASSSCPGDPCATRGPSTSASAALASSRPGQHATEDHDEHPESSVARAENSSALSSLSAPLLPR